MVCRECESTSSTTRPGALLAFHTRHPEQSRNPVWLELDQKIDVAAVGEIVPHERSPYLYMTQASAAQALMM
jgi:hypothetical protein